jgi:pantothenate kinase
MPTQVLSRPIHHLLGLLAAAAAPRILIGLAGFPGSGKSTVAARLADAVNSQTGDHTMVVLGMDGFHLTKATLATFPDPAAALARRGAPWTFDAPALATRLQALREVDGVAQYVSWPGFEHGVGDPVPDAVQVPPTTRLVLVEGLYLLHAGDGWGLSHLFDERWFLDVPLDVAMSRLVLRHMASGTPSRAQAQHRVDMNDRLNADIVQSSRARAQWLLVNDAVPVA